MSVKRYTSALSLLLFISALVPLMLLLEPQLNAMSNLTKNDPYPLYTAAYPYEYLAQIEKVDNFMFRREEYEETRFRLNFSIFRQFAKCATAIDRKQVPIGDLPNGCGINFSGLFFDPAIGIPLANELALDIKNFTPTSLQTACVTGNDEITQDPPCCLQLIRTPAYQDITCDFGYLSSETVYRKYGVRFEADFLLIDTCFDAVGMRLRAGVADVRHTVTLFVDKTCTATICINGCSFENNECCTAYTCSCKDLVINKIIKQKEAVAELLGYDLCDTYHKVGPEDVRLSVFWRHLYDLNPEDALEWPRAVVIPFIEAGVSIPMTKHIDPRFIYGIPLGNNGHVGAGAWGGVLIDFPDTVEIGAQAGFTHFFSEKYCNYPLPTYEFESILHPYRADVEIKPGTTWHGAISLYAWHFLENLSFWGEYVVTSHGQDKIKICRSLLPPDSIFNPDFQPSTAVPDSSIAAAEILGIRTGRGFLVDQAECLTKWESHLFNFAFTYDISPYVQLGIVWQTSFKQRNAFRSNTVLGSVIMTY